MLKDYRPQSIYKIPVTEIAKAKFPVIDMHSHPYAKTAAEIEEWVRNMDEVGIEKTIILTMSTGAEFDEIQRKYAKYPERFEMWCGFDFAGYDKPGFGPAAVKELERCKQAGARGVGEIHDKGKGLRSGKSKAPGMHPDDPRMDAVWEKCGELGMPVSLHVADPIWMYQKMDRHNDGLMNAYEWRLDNQPDIVGLSGMVDILERTAGAAPKHDVHRVPLRQSGLRSGAAGRGAGTQSESVCGYFRAVRGDGADSALRRERSMRSMRTGWCTAPTWASTRRCTG